MASSSKVDLPDPFLFDWGGNYYLYTSSGFGVPRTMNIPMMVAPHPSVNSQPAGPVHANWGPVTDALPTLPPWAHQMPLGARVWAPDVVRLGSRFLMYFAPTTGDPTPISHCIGIATSSSPSGPFVPVPGPPIVCQTSRGGDIDPQFFVDPHGPMGPNHPNYLLWKSDDNVLGGPDTAWAAPLSDNGLALSGPAVPILNLHQAFEQPFLEAPQMVAAPNGSDWLVFSGGAGFWTAGSLIGIASCDGPLGPCHDTRTTPLIGSNAEGAGPGEETVYVSPRSGVWILYSPWPSGNLGVLRPVEAAHLGFNGFGPLLVDPGRGPLAG